MAAITADDHAYSGLPNKLVSAANGVEYSYRYAGEGRGGVPLVLLNHFRGNLHHAEFAADVETFLSEPR